MITDALGEESVRFWHKAYGAIAQLGEHLLCTQGVSGSNPLSSTTYGGLSIIGTAAVLKTVHVKACGSSSLSSSAMPFHLRIISENKTNCNGRLSTGWIAVESKLFSSIKESVGKTGKYLLRWFDSNTEDHCLPVTIYIRQLKLDRRWKGQWQSW